jgi:CRISPR-associated protein Csm5
MTTYRLQLETLSPVMVTAGPEARLSPYTDFVQEGSDLVYLDPRKLGDNLAGQPPAVMDEFVRGVRTGMDNNRSNFDLAEFLRTRLGIGPAALALRRVPVSGQVRRNHVRRHVSNGGQPYVPGSTMKGAIRTALFYSWLIRDQAGLRFVDELAEKVAQLWERLRPQLGAAEEFFREAQRAYEQGDRGVQRGKRGEGDRIAGAVRRQVEEALKEFSEEKLFGPRSGAKEGAEMRFLRVSDTAPVPTEKLQVVEVTRLKLGDASTVSPQWSEVIPKGVRTTFTITVEPRFTRPDLAFLNEGSLVPLLERLDRFAGHCIGWDTNVLEGLPEVASFDDVFNAQAEIEALELAPTGAILRLGGGKTYFDNSLGLALFRRDPGLFDRFRRLLGLGRNPQTRQFSGKRFPSTRSYVVRSSGREPVPTVPLGWVKVQLQG